MYFLVSYDIADPKRLRQVCRILEGVGVREQYSVFLCNMGSMRAMLILWDTLLARINPKEDRLSAYPLDSKSLAQALHAGNFPESLVSEPLIFVV